MLGTKRKHKTVDDLLRMQERPVKRRRPSRKLEDAAATGSGLSEAEDSDVDPSHAASGVEEFEEDEMERSSIGHNSSDSESDDDEDARAQGPTSRLVKEHSSPSTSRLALKRNGTLASSVALAHTSTTFATLGIATPLITAMAGMSIRAPTEIQSACIPPLLAGKSTSLTSMGIS